MKRHLFYTFLTLFVLTSIVTLLGVTGVITIRDGYLTSLVAAFLVETAGAVIAIFNRADFFTDDSKTDEIVASINERHAATMAQINAEHADAIARVEKKYADQQARVETTIKQSLGFPDKQ
jgi:hypothetical protein